MDTIQISSLELQIGQLIRELERIQEENKRLRQQLNQDTKRYETLSAKNNLAAEKIKKIISQLRESMS